MLAVTPYYEPEGGGLERYAHAILSRIAARGHDVRAVAFTMRAAGEEVHGGVGLRRVRAAFRLSQTPLDPGFLTLLGREIAAFAPDVVLAHTPVPFPAEMASLAAERAGVPLVVTYHAGKLEGGTRFLDALAAMDRATFEARMLAKARRLIAVSPFVRDGVLGAHRSKVTVIPPGVDAARFAPGRAADPGRILFVGPLDRGYRWKGLDTLWEAFTRVRRAVPEATLTLVGDGDRRAEFEQRAMCDGLRDAVHVAGRLPLDGLVRAYQGAAVAVLPSTSRAESFGMVLAEANACGRPVVGSRVGGIPDFVRHGDNGLLAEPGDPGDLARMLVQLLRDPARAEAMGAAGRARVLREHGWDALAARTLVVLDNAVDRAGLPAPRAAALAP